MGSTFGSSQVSRRVENRILDQVVFVGARGLRTDIDIRVLQFDTRLSKLRSTFASRIGRIRADR